MHFIAYIYYFFIEFIRWFHEFSVTTNLRIFQETDLLKSHSLKTKFIFVKKIRRFIVTEFVKLSDEFDITHRIKSYFTFHFFPFDHNGISNLRLLLKSIIYFGKLKMWQKGIHIAVTIGQLCYFVTYGMVCKWLHVNFCQKLFFLQNMGRTCCVQKLSWKSETISVHNIFSPGLSLEFNEQSVIILWVSWCKNKRFWQRFTCTCVRLVL